MLRNKEFGEMVKAQLQERLGDGYDVQLIDVNKNNGMVLTGLNIRKAGTNVAPTIYLEGFEQRYGAVDGRSAAEEIEEIYRREEKNGEGFSGIESIFRDKGGLLGKIYPKVVNASKNEALLAEAPHKRLLDLAVIYYCKLEMPGHGIGSIVIKNQHLGLADITAEELEKAAFENLQKTESKAKNMADMIEEMTGESHEGIGEVPMVVLTNKDNLNGAVEMLMADVMEKICEKFNSDAYVLPSSIHEVILVPVRQSVEVEYLRSMVKEVNATQLAEEEVLSDSVYIYRRADRHLAVA